MWLLRLGHKRYCGCRLFLRWLTLGEAAMSWEQSRSPIVRSTWGRTEASCQQPCKWISWAKSLPPQSSLQVAGALADILTTTHWNSQSQKHLTKPFLDSWSPKALCVNDFFLTAMFWANFLCSNKEYSMLVNTAPLISGVFGINTATTDKLNFRGVSHVNGLDATVEIRTSLAKISCKPTW